MKNSFAISLFFMLALIIMPLHGNAAIASGNWFLQASTQSTGGGSSQIPQIGGSLSQTGSIISGVLHVSNSGCFDWATDIPVSGTVSGNAVNLISDGANGEVVTINGTESSTQITGTYSIASGCADGDYGTITAVLLSPATGNWTGTFANDGSGSVTTASFSQAVPNADGYSLLSGIVTLAGPQCTLSGTLADGQSWVLGNVIQGVVKMSERGVMSLNGFIADVANSSNQITINFSISGGGCSGLSGSVTYNRS